MTKRDRRIVACLNRHGIVYPRTTLRLARRVNHETSKMPLARACALLDQESAGGHNVFGHDPVQSIVGGRVTRARYLYYKARRKAGLGMQGVGGLQLTWYEFQDDADRRGGCWRANISMYVGLSIAANLIRAKGYLAGIAAYNGSGSVAQHYANTVAQRERAWRRILEREV